MKTMAKKPNRSVKEMVVLLRQQGHSVDFISPSNGALRIVRIDGRHFRHDSSEGNQLARELTGSSLPAPYRSYISKRVRAQAKARERAKPLPLTSAQKKQLRALNKRAKKLGVKTITTKQAGWLKKRRVGQGGWKSVIKDYRKQLYLSKNFDPAGAHELAERLNKKDGLAGLADLVEKNKYLISSDTVRYIWEMVYERWTDKKLSNAEAQLKAANRIEKEVAKRQKWLAERYLDEEDIIKTFGNY